MKSYLVILIGLICYKSFSLHITYNGNLIDTESKFKTMMDQIKTDPHFNKYLDIQEKIMQRCDVIGPLISSNWNLSSDHIGNLFNKKNGSTNRFFFQPIWSDKPGWRFNKAITGEYTKIPNTSCVLQYLYNVREAKKTRPDGGFWNILEATDGPIDMPIAKPATVDDIKNPNNKFYALSCTLHGEKIRGDANFSSLQSYLASIVRCKPTVDNPKTSRYLRFDIDNDNNPFSCTTAYGDGGQALFVVTEQEEIKTVGIHIPGGNYFNVDNIAYPSTAAFIDETIETVPEPFTISMMSVSLGMFIKRNRNKCLTKK